MTAGELHRALVADFKQVGIETPELDARLLIQFEMNWSHTDYVMAKQDGLSQDSINAINALAARRKTGEPIDHIFGYREFYGRKFKVTKDVLTPRPETEGLVEKAIQTLRGAPSPHILDLGTGTGAIIISILAEIPTARGVAVDISKAALDIARENAKTHNLEGQLDLLLGDWFEPVSGTYDLIVSNPPYITPAAMDALSVEVRDFDPDLALRGGEDGLVAYKVILSSAEDFLKPDGHVHFEIGYDQGETVSDLMKNAGYVDVRVLKDLAGHDRIVCGTRRDN